jgi:hypothetical protein
MYNKAKNYVAACWRLCYVFPITTEDVNMTLEARTMADLVSKIYAAEGWVRSRGESKIYRAQTAYKITIDHKGNRFVAVKK